MDKLPRHPAADLPWTIGLTLPGTATEAGARFFEAWARTNALVPFIHGSASAAHVALTILTTVTKALELPREQIDAILLEASKKQAAKGEKPLLPGAPMELLNAHGQLIWELVYCRQVDNFIAYLTALLYEAFTRRPEILKEKGKTIDWATVLSQATIEDVVHVLAERKVNELAYKSFGDLRGYFRQERGIDIAEDDVCTVINEAIAIRNISVHNGCVINEQFIKLVPTRSRSSIGTFKWLSIDDFELLAGTLGKVVTDLDARAIKHFGLAAYPMQVDPHKHRLADEPPPVSDDPVSDS